MSSLDFNFCGATLTALPCGGLWWEGQRLLCVTDLHLGRAERIARLGGALLPPYDTADTLLRLRGRIEEFAPRTVISLGDSFDDQNAEFGLAASETRMLAAMMAGRKWVWIAGNHDPGPIATGGTWVADFRAGPLTFRHIAQAGAAAGEVSGHFHPKMRVSARGRSISRPCFLADATRLILPAFGAYTGGLDCGHPAIGRLFPGGCTAYLTGSRVLAMPVTAPEASHRIAV